MSEHDDTVADARRLAHDLEVLSARVEGIVANTRELVAYANSMQQRALVLQDSITSYIRRLNGAILDAE